MANAETTTDRDKLRGERKLSLVSIAEQGSHMDFIPPGTYGFTYSPSTEGIPIFANSTFQAFEVHKLFSGAVHLLGYLTAAEAKSFDSAKDTTELKLYPEPYQDATVFVSVPATRILKAKPTTRDNGNFMGFLCLPKES